MLLNILKKDLKRKKVMNLILFVFIILCTIFLASSVSNIFTTMNALDYFADASQLSDYMIAATNDDLTEWLEEAEDVLRFEVDQLFELDRILVGEPSKEIEGTTRVSRLPQEMSIPLNLSNQALEPLAAGEIAISFRLARENNIEIGDTLYVEFEGDQHAFEVVQLAKDILSPMFRVFISDEDFTQITNSYDLTTMHMYVIDVEDLSVFTRTLNQAGFSGLVLRIDAAMFMMMFMLDLMMMVILVLVGVSLIAISFVVLRFSIVFTLQEDQKEIGIMKAIGLKDKDIKRVYLIKYLFLASFGAVIGFFLSLPFSEWFMAPIRENIAFPDAGSMIWLQIVSALVIVLLTLTFCYMSTRKLKKITAMQAIRSGETGERSKRKGLIYLHRMKSLPTVAYLALNDILSNTKSYLVLLVIFTLTFMLAIMPLNAANTLSPEMLAELTQIPATDVFFDNVEFERFPFDGNVAQLKEELAVMENFYLEHGVEINLQAKLEYSGIVYTDSIYDGVIMNGINQTVGDEQEALQVSRGAAPMLANEIAISESTLRQLGANIGDEVNLSIDGESYQFLVTGAFHTMRNMGAAVELSEQVTLSDEAIFGLFTFQGNFVNRTDIEGQLATLDEVNLMTEITIMTLEDFMSDMADFSIVEVLRQLILMVIILVNILIISLMSVSFMMRDLKQIALVKSLGFSNKAIKLWQGFRILFVMILSLVLGSLLMPIANMLAGIPFAVMGTPGLDLNVDVMQVYVIYPLIFIVVTGLTLVITTLGVKKVGLRDLGVTD